MDEITPLFDPEDDLFSFESDHLALKGNEDYCDVLKTLVILNAQRERALKDYKAVAELRLEALRDPFSTLEKIQNGSDLGVPPMINVPKLPHIDFKKYKVRVPESELTDIYVQKKEEKLEFKEPSYDNSGNRSWTSEEQKRLEELLQVYPPEPIELRRFQKIANALGNRTVQQVASRVQKYFLKLYKAGLPIPGRIPKSGEKYKARKSGLHKHQRHNHYLWKPSTFFPELSIPVQMEDLNSIPGPSNSSVADSVANVPTADNYLMRTEYHQDKEEPESEENDNELQLKLLKRLREVKVKEVSGDYVPYNHLGFKCDYCDEQPITGARWHCTVCLHDSVDFCTDCVISQMYSENPHPIRHWLTVYEDVSENSSENGVFSEPTTMFDRQIAEELKGDALEARDTDEDDFSE